MKVFLFEKIFDVVYSGVIIFIEFILVDIVFVVFIMEEMFFCLEFLMEEIFFVKFEVG